MRKQSPVCPLLQVNILLCLFDIAAGMNYLHSIGIMHSDLKAANVLLKSSAVTQDDPPRLHLQGTPGAVAGLRNGKSAGLGVVTLGIDTLLRISLHLTDPPSFCILLWPNQAPPALLRRWQTLACRACWRTTRRTSPPTPMVPQQKPPSPYRRHACCAAFLSRAFLPLRILRPLCTGVRSVGSASSAHPCMSPILGCHADVGCWVPIQARWRT